jgi:voltage-gated potassium channel
VLIDARDDNEAMAVALKANRAASAGHVVVALRDLSRTVQVHYMHPRLHTVQWHSHRIITEELKSPGISRVYAQLMARGGRNTYSFRLGRAALGSFGDCQTGLGRRFDATVLAMDTGDELLISPPWSAPVPAGATLYYVCERPLSVEEIEAAAKVGVDGAAGRDRV